MDPLRNMRRIGVVLFILTGLFAGMTTTPAIARSQVTALRDARTEAIQRRNAGDFSGAVALLQEYLKTNPADGEAIRLLAETLYWEKDFAASRSVSEAALELHPEDTDLRLQYARMLIETGYSHRAREVLAPLRPNSTGGRAEAILGTLAYWEGDFAEADKLFATAIASGNTDPAVRRMHTEIALVTAPWVKVSPEYQHDDQPIDRTGVGGEAGWFPTPSTSVSLRGHALRFQLGDTATRNAWLAQLTIAHYAASARTDLNLSAGIVTRSFGSSSDLTGEAGAAVRLPHQVKLGVRLTRAPYFSTEASLSQAVMTNTGTTYARLDEFRGWLGEAVYQLQRYPDSNKLTSAYGWLLAPLVNTTEVLLRAGYSESWQTTSESRFTLAHQHQPFAPGDPRFDLSGLYTPYYTPIDLRSHSAIAAVTLHLTSVATFNANGAYAVRATESAPAFATITTTTPVTVQRINYQRSFNPWDAHASLELNPSPAVWVVANAGVFRTGFYAAYSASVALVFRLTGRATSMAGAY